MSRIVLVAAATAALMLSACGSGGPGSVAESTSVAEQPSPTTPAPGSGRLYEADATVLDDGEQGPKLCLGAMLLSLPPRCGDVPIANWDWEAVDGERSLSGTTWGDYHVVGTFDGEIFTAVSTGAYREPPPPDPVYESPCPEPAGGWVADPDRHTQEHDGGARAYARSQPDYVISFVDHVDDDLQEFSPVVFVAIFTGDRERHEAEIRKVWDGPLCVVELDTATDRELRRIRREAESALPELGLTMVGSWTGGVPPRVEIDVLADPGGAGQAALDARFGAGVVRLAPALTPVQ
jgi:hypothetical protein